LSEAAAGPLTSIVVPTRDRPEQLARCLSALERQTAAGSTEIIVVDDGSEDLAAVEAIVANHAGTRLLRQAPAGPAAARNRGVRSARGSYVCFTDDDCEPQPEWVERLIPALADRAAAAAGRTLNASPGNAFAEASELVGAALSTPAPNGGEGIVFARSNNLACRKDLLAQISFDEEFPVAAGEDREWCARLLAAGHVVVSEPRAVVLHRQQFLWRGFWNQQVRYGRGAYRFRAAIGRRRAREPAAFYAGLVRDGFRAGPRVGVLVIVAQVATALGFVAEWRASRTTPPAAGRAPAEQMPPGSGWDGGEADQMVDAVER
jgi:glycosyltransferase involved in cell wall biosynthesis